MISDPAFAISYSICLISLMVFSYLYLKAMKFNAPGELKSSVKLGTKQGKWREVSQPQ